MSKDPFLHTHSRDLHSISARTRELPNNFPYIVKKQYIGKIVKQWNDPSQQLFGFAKRELKRHVELQIASSFSQYTYGQLKQRVAYALHFHPTNVPFVYDGLGAS